MSKLFLQILNMSLTASYVILFVLLARLALKKAPKVFSYALWSVVLFRLLCPFSFESILSLIPCSVPEITGPPRMFSVAFPPVGTPEWSAAITAADHSAYVTKPVWTVHDLLAIVWLAGIAVLLVYSVVSLLRLRSKLVGSVKWQGNIRLADRIPSPFVMGIIRPKIYLPSTLAQEEQAYVVLHEQTHIRRLDYIFKLIAFFALVVHWFNPLVWFAYVLFIKDMEMSCDESVMKSMNTDIRQKYSASLLSFATGKRIMTGTPLAFGESDTKSRIKNVMHYKKPTLWVAVAAAVLVGVVGIGFAMNRVTAVNLPNAEAIVSVSMDRYTGHASAGEIVVTGKDEIQNVLGALSGATKTMRRSTNDYPTENEYLVVRLRLENETRTLCLYADGANYIEEPYVAIYRAKKNFDGLYSMYAAYSQGENAPASGYEAHVWVDGDEGDIFALEDATTELAEYPGVTFRWTSGEVTVVDSAGERVLFTGMPVWNGYWADLSGDGLPELCATISYGSGFIDTRVIVFDYANNTLHELSDRMVYDYSLLLENGRMFVAQTEALGGVARGTGELTIVGGKLVAIGIDRTIPSPDPEETSPLETRNAETTLHEAFFQLILKLYEMDPGLNNEIKYIAVDLTKIREDVRVSLEADLLVWTESLNCQLLLDTYEGLVQSGHIFVLSPDETSIVGFEEGILFSIGDFSLGGETLTVDASKYRGPIAAVGANFVLRFADGSWTIEDPEEVWMA